MLIFKRDQLKRLTDKAKENLNAAEYLFEVKSYDLSVKRSYFTMFYIACGALFTLDLVFDNHNEVLDAFKKHFIDTGIFDAGCYEMLAEAKRYRLNDNNEFNKDITEETARRILENAKKFKAEMKKHINQWLDDNPA